MSRRAFSFTAAALLALSGLFVASPAAAADAPAVISISPDSGFGWVSSALTITGSGFTTDATVFLGGAQVDTTSITETSITVSRPPQLAIGPEDVTVTEAGGTATLAGGYTVKGGYVQDQAFETGADTAYSGNVRFVAEGDDLVLSAPPQHGQVATLDGDGFFVYRPDAGFSGTDSFGVALTGALVEPTESTATVTMTVGPPRQPLPTVTSVTPSSGPETGGTRVTITGTDFTNVTRVSFGSYADAEQYTVVNASTITATSPVSSFGVGTTVVLVATSAGQSAAQPSAEFSYEAVTSTPTPTPTPTLTPTAPHHAHHPHHPHHRGRAHPRPPTCSAGR